VIDADLQSTGSLPFGPFGVIDLGDRAQAKVIVDSEGRTLGYHLVSPLHYGVVLDLDNDGVADIVDAVAFAPFHRVYAENSTGSAFRADLGTADCVGAGPSGWDPAVASLASCDGSAPQAAADSEQSRFELASFVLPADGDGTGDIADIGTGIWNAEQSAQGPSAADGQQLASDLENFGAEVLVGAYTNDAVGEQFGDAAAAGAGWIGSGIQAHGGSAGDHARQFGRGSDDLVTQATALLDSLTPGAGGSIVCGSGSQPDLLTDGSELTTPLPDAGHRLPKLLVRDVQVTLRLLHVSVAEHQLDRSDVHSITQQPTGALVTKIMPVEIDLL